MAGSAKATCQRQRKLPKGLAANPMTEQRWQRFLELICNGLYKQNALHEIEVTDMTFQAWLIKQPEAAEQYRQAQLAWLRREWPLELVEEMTTDIAMGQTVKLTCEQRGLRQDQFYKVVTTDPYYRELYKEARQVAAEKMADDIVELCDNVELDGVNTTANSAKVNHARLQVTTRQWLMSKLHHERFGERIKQDIDSKVTVDHVEELDKARKRKELAAKERDQILRDQAASVH